MAEYQQGEALVAVYRERTWDARVTSVDPVRLMMAARDTGEAVFGVALADLDEPPTRPE